jgi:hypothetical protein
VGKSFFTLYLYGYISTLLKGEASTMPHEKEISGSW